MLQTIAADFVRARFAKTNGVIGVLLDLSNSLLFLCAVLF
jgi:hypothetical protein